MLAATSTELVDAPAPATEKQQQLKHINNDAEATRYIAHTASFCTTKTSKRLTRQTTHTHNTHTLLHTAPQNCRLKHLQNTKTNRKATTMHQRDLRPRNSQVKTETAAKAVLSARRRQQVKKVENLLTKR